MPFPEIKVSNFHFCFLLSFYLVDTFMIYHLTIHNPYPRLEATLWHNISISQYLCCLNVNVIMPCLACLRRCIVWSGWREWCCWSLSWSVPGTCPGCCRILPSDLLYTTQVLVTSRERGEVTDLGTEGCCTPGWMVVGLGWCSSSGALGDLGAEI